MRTRIHEIGVVALVVTLFVAGTVSPIVAWAEEGTGQSGVRPVAQVGIGEMHTRGSAPADGGSAPESPSLVASVVIASVSVVSLLSVPMTMRRLAKADDEESGGMDDETGNNRRHDSDDGVRDGATGEPAHPTGGDADDTEDAKILLDGGQSGEFA